MKQKVCPNCGGNEFRINGRQSICQFCESVFDLSTDEVRNDSSIAINDDVEALLEKCRKQPFMAKRLAHLILELDPNNKEIYKYL